MSQCKINKNKMRSLFKLSAYSLQLNLIEILWRFMKYEWMELNADETLISYIEKVLRDFGSNYVINFAQLISIPTNASLATRIFRFLPIIFYHSPTCRPSLAPLISALPLISESPCLALKPPLKKPISKRNMANKMIKATTTAIAII